jgi:hypothetical protein
VSTSSTHVRKRRTFARACLDWSERRPHLGGALGAAVAGALLRQDWLRRTPNDRVLTVTPTGELALRGIGVDLSSRDAALIA